jgi:hypothetical protein
MITFTPAWASARLTSYLSCYERLLTGKLENYVPYSKGTASDDCYASIEVLRVDFLRSNDFAEYCLHVDCAI